MVRNCRVTSELGIGSIALGDIRSMLDEFRIEEPDVRVYYIQLIMALDTVWITHMAKSRK